MNMTKIYNAVNLIIINKNNEVLLIKRNSNENVEPNKWCIPGGTVEDLENFEEGVKREILEEVGTEIIEYKYFKSYYANIIQPVRAVYFTGKINENNIKLNQEATEFKWFNKENINEINIAFNQKEILNEFFKN